FGFQSTAILTKRLNAGAATISIAAFLMRQATVEADCNASFAGTIRGTPRGIARGLPRLGLRGLRFLSGGCDPYCDRQRVSSSRQGYRALNCPHAGLSSRGGTY